jgi:hypothetical protein
MSKHQSSYLLAALLGILATRGLSPEALDPWRGWVAFKEFARAVAETPDPGVSVQLEPEDGRQPIHLYLTRQVLVEDGERLEPVGAVVCEFVFAPRRRRPLEWREWSFDHSSFDRYVDAVEQYPLFADLLATRPLRSAVYWEAA